MKKNTIIGIIVAVVIIAAGIFVVKRAQNKENALPPAKSYSVTVSVMKPEIKQVELTLPFLAQTQNDKDVILASKVAARVDFVKPSGSIVRKGEVVARLDNTSIESSRKSTESQIAATKTALQNLKSTHARTLELLAVKGASLEQSEGEESRIADLESKLESLKQGIADMNNTLTYATIKSPVDGQITTTNVNAGNMVMPGQPVATISANSDFYLSVYVPTDTKVYKVILNNKTYPVTPLNSTLNGLAAYKINVPAPNMTTGERVEVSVVVYTGNAIKLPFDAILNREGISYVLVKVGDKAKAQKINIIQNGEDGAVISNAELAGKEIVVAKQDILLTLLSGVSLNVKEE